MEENDSDSAHQFSRRDFFRRLRPSPQVPARKLNEAAESSSSKKATPDSQPAELISPPPHPSTARINSPRRASQDSTPLRTWLRPPGAVSEDQFLAHCTRCNDCIDVCPHQAIHQAGAKHGVAAGTPIIEPLLNACYFCEDLPCIAACDEQVLLPNPVIRMSEVLLLEWGCLAYQGQECSICSDHCPVPGAMTATAGKPKINSGLCTGCALCQSLCPEQGSAIVIRPIVE